MRFGIIKDRIYRINWMEMDNNNILKPGF